MNLFFGETELDTLFELQQIAKKHNSTIKFGCESGNGCDLDNQILLKNGVEQKVIDLLEEQSDYSLSDIRSSYDKVWFEVYEKDTRQYHVMSYSMQNLYFNLDKTYVISDYDEDCEEKQLLEDFIDNRLEECCSGYYGSFNHCPTIITGFGNTEKITDYRVYRSGMALKFFSDLVCDYFKEHRIEKTY